MDKVSDSISSLLDKITFLPSNDVKLAIIGAILVIVFFLLALIFTSGSKINGLRKKLLAVIKGLGIVSKVDENNVEIVYSELKQLPEPVAKGWGLFLERRDDYPSTYIQDRDVITDKDYSGHNAAGKVFFAVFSAIIWALVAFCAVLVCGKDSFSLEVLFKEYLMASILFAVLVPVAVFVIFWFLLGLAYSNQRKKLDIAFADFQKTLDEKVIIAPKEEEPYAEETLQDVVKKVEDLTESIMENKGEDIITVPEPVEEEYVVDEPIVEPKEEKQEVVMTPEEEERYLSILAVIVDDALADPKTTDKDLEDIAVLIAEAKETGFPNEKDQAILEECLYKLADKYYA